MLIKDEILDKIKPIIKNYKVYLVGGYLRNYFLTGEISTDRDLVCQNNAKELSFEIAEKLDATFVELDRENEIYRVVLKDKTNYFDISKALNNSFEEDAKRRDFTINSIFYDLISDELYDLNNGISDIENKIIRTPDLNNLKDDPLRLLRMYRFKSLTGFEIDETLKKYAVQNFSLIKNSAKERINYEIIKMFEGNSISQTLIEMYDDGVLEIVFPFVSEIKRVPPNSHHHLDLIHHSIETVKNIETNNPLLKIAAVYHDIGKPSVWTIEPVGRHRFIGHDVKGAEIAKSELKDLKFSKKQISYITQMIKYHIYPAALVNCEDKKKAFAKFVRKLGKNSLDVIELSKADRLSALGSAVTKEMLDKSLSHLEELKKYYLEVQSILKAPKPLLSGDEIMNILNLKPSKQVGEIIEKLLEAQLEKTVQTKEEALEFIKNKAVKQLNG